MNSSAHEKQDLLIAWTTQCFQAAGLDASETEARKYAASAASEIIDEGFAGFAEGNSVPHGSGSNTVAGGTPVPDFVQKLHEGFGDDSTPPVDMSKVTVGKAMVGSGCAIAALVMVAIGLTAILLVAVI
jgi:hypothetical protein